MESTRIDALLEKYFEGNTSLEEENTLNTYFAQKEIAEHLKPYQPLFASLEVARSEVSTKEVELPGSQFKLNPRWYGVAALVVIGLTVGGFVYNSQGLSAEEKEALAAYEEARSAMYLLSENLNKGTASLTHLNEFSKGQEKVAHLNNFTEAKNKILK